MEEYSSRRTVGGLVVSRRGPNFLRDSVENNRDRNVQVCSRVGCSSKLNQMKDTQFGSPSKAKSFKTPFRSAHGKEIVGSSSRSSASSNTSRKSSSESKKKLAFHLETDSETSCLQDESDEASVSTPVSGKTQSSVHPEQNKHESDDSKSAEAGTCTSGPTNRSVKKNNLRFGMGKQNSAGGSSDSFAFKQTNQGARNGANSTRYNLRHLRCDSISDVVISGSSSSPESNRGRKRDTGRKRIGEPESSLSARGKKMNGPMLEDRRTDNTNRGVSISESRRTRTLNLTPDNDAPPVRNRRSTARTRLSNQETRNRLPLVESPLLASPSTQAEISLDENASSSESAFSTQTPYSSGSYNRPGSGGERMRPSRSVGPHEIARSLMNRDTLRQYNLDGIAEMLLALDGIEPDEEPTYEQLLVMETHLFLGGLAFQDQHREMRLDIDNMSYEELLALTERIGTVSTAVPEEVLAKCLKRSIYQATEDCRENEDDIKCCICQEEYADGDEVGRLDCDHRYHIDCVNQWLRLKNWCPICKVSAAPLPSASPPH